VVGTFLLVDAVRGMRRQRGESRILAVLFKLFGRHPVETAVLVVAGRLDVVEAHLLQLLEHLHMVGRILGRIANQVAVVVQLRTQFLLRRMAAVSRPPALRLRTRGECQQQCQQR